MAASSGTTQLPDVDLTVDYINHRCEQLGLTLEQADRIAAVVRAIRETLRYGITVVCAALAVPKTAQLLPMIQPRHLKQVIGDPDLLTAMVSRDSMTDAALSDCQLFLQLLEGQTLEQAIRQIDLDCTTVTAICLASELSGATSAAVNNVVEALLLSLVDEKNDLFAEMRAEVGYPPFITSVMVESALESWDMWHHLLNEHPTLVTYTDIKLTREFLTKLY